MSTLTYTNETFTPAAPETEKAPRSSIWRRAFYSLVRAQQRRADREIARYLEIHGGILTDEMEREIMRRLAGNKRRVV